MASDEALDQLYGLPLDQFTQARNQLAVELRTEGKREEADEVKSMRKPPLSAWAVNQLARKERMQVRSLVNSAERLRKAQAGLLRGGDADELRGAVERQREVVGALVRQAKDILRSAGHPATEATMERIRETLTAVAADEEGAKLVQQGRLEKDLDPTGFGPIAPAGKPPKGKARGDTRKKRIEQAKKDVDELRAQVREREERALKAASESARAERAADAARKAAEKEETALDGLRQRLEEAKDALERARSS